ncbi:MAG: PP2C family protein-serine/threonine phosphatase [Flammeovirgaceae bacterium]
MNHIECIETLKYQLAGYTIPKFNKDKNGDDFAIAYLEEERLLIGVVSDGVSQQPCDWLASEITCKGFIQHFKAQQGNNFTLTDRMILSIELTNQQLLYTEKPCEKLAATLAVCVVDEQAQMLYWCNIGDSRVYLVNSNTVQMLTRDDVTSFQETIQTSIGKRQIKRAKLTQCMGKNRVNPVVHQRDLKADELVLLASDGFYEARKASFNHKLLEFNRKSDFVDAFGKMASSFEIMRDDDMTFVALHNKSSEVWQ